MAYPTYSIVVKEFDCISEGQFNHIFLKIAAIKYFGTVFPSVVKLLHKKSL